MPQKSLKDIFETNSWVKFAEIAARKDQTIEQIVLKAKNFFDIGVDCLVFSDQPQAGDQFYSVGELAESGVFDNFPKDRILPVVVTRRRNQKELDTLINKLQKEQIPNLFPVTGDVGLGLDSRITSLDLLSKVKDNFYCGAVADPNISKITKIEQKKEAGAKFFITQASYDETSWNEWLVNVRDKKIFDGFPLVSTIIPVVSEKSLEILNKLGGVMIAKNVFDRFANLEDTLVKIRGLEMSKQMIRKNALEGIFSGIYVFSRSTSIVKELLNEIGRGYQLVK